jgi:hypothetical protein
MRIETPHTLDPAQARRRIDRMADDLLSAALPAGVEIQGAAKDWSGDRLSFTVRVRKGFFSTSLAGSLEVLATSVVLDLDLPPIVRSFAGEDRIRDIVSSRLRDLLTV